MHSYILYVGQCPGSPGVYDGRECHNAAPELGGQHGPDDDAHSHVRWSVAPFVVWWSSAVGWIVVDCVAGLVKYHKQIMKKVPILDAINNNKFFIGVMMILLNIGSRHLVDEFSGSEEDYKRNILLRRVAIFAVCFIATRDIIHSTLLTAGYVIIASGISRRSSEGMTNPGKVDPGNSKADYPAYDKSAPLLF